VTSGFVFLDSALVEIVVVVVVVVAAAVVAVVVVLVDNKFFGVKPTLIFQI